MISIVVHGGAWAIPQGLRAKSENGVRVAVEAGYAVLARGGSALDAVEAAVRVLEDDPVFDAGTGSVFNAHREVVSECVWIYTCRSIDAYPPSPSSTLQKRKWMQ